MKYEKVVNFFAPGRNWVKIAPQMTKFSVLANFLGLERGKTDEVFTFSEGELKNVENVVFFRHFAVLRPNSKKCRIYTRFYTKFLASKCRKCRTNTTFSPF